jgi:hypothetical protein
MSEKQKDQSLDLVAEDITVDQLQDEQVVENVEVSDEETDNVDTDADSVEESMEAEKEVDGEKAAAEVADTVKKSAPKQANAPKTKAGLINASYKAMSQMTKEELTSLYDTMMNVQEDAEEMTEEVVAEDEFVTDTVEIKVDFQEDLNALVSEDEALSEEFKDKAAVIFEAAVTSKLSAEINRLEEQYTTELSEEVEQIKTDLVEKVDGYLSYVVENWMEENKVAVETGLRAEIAESFITGLKGLFEQHYVEVPETKYNLVDDLASKVAELEESLNESTEDNIKLSEQVSNLRRDQIIAEATSGMVEIDAAKLMSLVEGVDFESAATFSKKVSIVKESYFKTAKSVMIDESTDIATDEKGVIVESSPTMSRYVSALSKTTK